MKPIKNVHAIGIGLGLGFIAGWGASIDLRPKPVVKEVMSPPNIYYIPVPDTGLDVDLIDFDALRNAPQSYVRAVLGEPAEQSYPHATEIRWQYPAIQRRTILIRFNLDVHTDRWLASYVRHDSAYEPYPM